MLSILYDEYLKWGCPNCGCDAIKGSCVSGGGLTSGTCKHCGIHFEVRSNNPTAKCLYGAYPENPSDPNSEWVKEEAIKLNVVSVMVKVLCVKIKLFPLQFLRVLIMAIN